MSLTGLMMFEDMVLNAEEPDEMKVWGSPPDIKIPARFLYPKKAFPGLVVNMRRDRSNKVIKP